MQQGLQKPKRSYDPLDQDALLEEVSGATKQQPPWVGNKAHAEVPNPAVPQMNTWGWLKKGDNIHKRGQGSKIMHD